MAGLWPPCGRHCRFAGLWLFLCAGLPVGGIMGLPSVMGGGPLFCVFIKRLRPFCGCGKRGVNARVY